jgi:hypothetical protein
LLVLDVLAVVVPAVMVTFRSDFAGAGAATATRAFTRSVS